MENQDDLKEILTKTQRTLWRFLEKVDVKSNDKCWEWLGYKTWEGYGRLRNLNREKILVHRFSWLIHFGKIPEGMLICHHCDNPPCVNPEHLFMGTHQDNAIDRERKNRRKAPKGEESSLSKLKNKDVIEIREKFRNGKRNCDLAREYKVHPSTISLIVLKKKNMQINFYKTKTESL